MLSLLCPQLSRVSSLEGFVILFFRNLLCEVQLKFLTFLLPLVGRCGFWNCVVCIPQRPNWFYFRSRNGYLSTWNYFLIFFILICFILIVRKWIVFVACYQGERRWALLGSGHCLERSKEGEFLGKTPRQLKLMGNVYHPRSMYLSQWIFFLFFNHHSWAQSSVASQPCLDLQWKEANKIMVFILLKKYTL